MSATLSAISTYRTRNGMRPLAEVAADQATALRAALGRPTAARTPARAAARARVEAFVAANARPEAHRPAPVAVVGDPARPTYAQVDALAMTVPTGCYALPRNEASTAGNTVTFFKVHPFRGGRRIVQLLGAPGGFVERPLPVMHQFFALTHVADDPKSASMLFGRETATCGVCDSPLTNDKSRALGIGPVCRNKL